MNIFSSLLVRQYDSVGELIRALEKTYIINAKTKDDVAEMWVGLSQIRALLPVQMSQEEEELMRERLWKLVNNHTFFQHPDLIRVLRIHENVMAVMINTLGRRSQAQSDANAQQTNEGEVATKEKVSVHFTLLLLHENISEVSLTITFVQEVIHFLLCTQFFKY